MPRRKRSSTSPSLLPSSLPSSSSTSPGPSLAATMQQPQPQPQPRSNDNNQNSIKNSPTSSSTSPSIPPPSSTLPSTSSSAQPPRPLNPQPHVSTAGVDTSALISTLVKTDKMSPTLTSQVMASSSMASTAGRAKEGAEVVALLNQILQNIPPPADIDDSSDKPSTSSRRGSSAVGPMSKKTALRERLQRRLENRRQHPQQDDDDDHHRSPPLTSTSRPSSAAAAAGSEAINNSTGGEEASGGGSPKASLQDQLVAISLDYAKYALEKFRYPEADQIPGALATVEFGIQQMTELLTKLKEIDNAAAAETAAKSKEKKKEKKKPKEGEEEKPMEEDVDVKKEVEACQAQANVILDLFHAAKEMVVGGDVQRETRREEGTRHSSSTPLTAMASSDIGADHDAESSSVTSGDNKAAEGGL